MADPNSLPVIPETERTPLVEFLLARIGQLLEEQRRQAELIGQLRDEIAVLKGEKARPKFKPSGMEQQTEPGSSEGDADGDAGTGAGDGTGGARKRPGSAKRPKTAQLTLHETVGVPPGMELPAGSRFKGSGESRVPRDTSRGHPAAARTRSLATAFCARVRPAVAAVSHSPLVRRARLRPQMA
jgi:hypothetical protein